MKKLKIIAILILAATLISTHLQSRPYKYGYYICMGAFRHKKNFDNYSSILRKAGIKILQGKAYYEGRKQYRIYYAKKFQTHEKAKAYIPNLLKYKTIMFDEGIDLWVVPGPIRPLVTNSIQMDFGDEFIYTFKTERYPYTVICEKGYGFLNTTGEAIDSSFRLVQAIPLSGTIPSGSPTVLFFNDKILLPSIINNIFLHSNGKIVPGTIRIFSYSDGRSAISIAPSNALLSGETTLAVSADLTDSTGRRLGKEIKLAFQYQPIPTVQKPGTSFEPNESSFLICGDGIFGNASSPLNAPDGDNFLALSNSDKILSKNQSLGETASYAAALLPNFSTIALSYNFISSEFNEFINSPYGDVAILFISGENYQKSYILSSVNKVGAKNVPVKYKSFANLPDKGDVLVGMSGWQDIEKENSQIKGNATATLIVTDIGDSNYTSVLLIDNIKIK